MMLNAWEGEPAWQLRGMATDASLQSLGVGKAVLDYLTELALARPRRVRLFWCNARVPALRFYTRQGWQVMSDQFEIPTAGPHRKLMKRL
jgi:GNAT superfamily N-acetyltransferase